MFIADILEMILWTLELRELLELTCVSNVIHDFIQMPSETGSIATQI